MSQMKMIIPPENQGQTVLIGYGWHDGSLYRCVYDQSDKTERWFIAGEGDSDNLPENWHPVNGEPEIRNWTLCDEPGD